MQDKINQTLIQLEKDLQEISSAREQVESTVEASNKLLQVVEKYISMVHSLSDSLKQWKTSLNEEETSFREELNTTVTNVKRLSGNIIESLGVQLKTISSVFQEQADVTVKKFIEQNSKLEKRVEELSALREQINVTTNKIENVKSSLEHISKDLKESQDEQDVALEEIKTKVSALPTIIQQSFESMSQAISHSEHALAETLNQINGKTDTLAINIANLTTLCQSVNSTITSSANNLTNVINNAKDDTLRTIKESQDEITKVSNIDRWIMIIGFIIVIIMFFVIK